MALTFGETYARLTSSAMCEIRARVRPPASIVDFGAGCGRLAIPLSIEGYRVTAVEPSGAMLGELRRRAPHLPLETTRMAMAEYRTLHLHDLALCVFTVIAYLPDEEALEGAFSAAARALSPGGHFLLDVPHARMFESFDYDAEEIIRHVEIEPVGGSLYAYREDTVLRTPEGPIRYVDDFRIRHWTMEQTLAALEQVGFVRGDDVSARFADLGADYLLMRRPA